jgi:inosine-uridine nucleoside N-ribohydrolase
MSASPTPIVLDCDPGHDDAIAIMVALGSPEVELRAVTTVAGNAPLHRTTANAIRILDFVGRADIPVAAGADRPLVQPGGDHGDVHGETGLDGPDLPPPAREPVAAHAVDVIAEAATSSDRPITLVATGPLTNVALLAALRPAAAAALERVVIMGGSIGLGNVTPAAEFNIWADPEAAARVFGSGIDVTMVGLDVTHKALFTSAHVGRLAGRVGRTVAELLEFYGHFHKEVYGFDGSPIHDAVAVAYVIRDDLVKTEHLNTEIDVESELCRGRTVVDVWRRSGREPNSHVGVDIDADGFLELLIERLNSLQ